MSVCTNQRCHSARMEKSVISVCTNGEISDVSLHEWRNQRCQSARMEKSVMSVCMNRQISDVNLHEWRNQWCQSTRMEKSVMSVCTNGEISDVSLHESAMSVCTNGEISDVSLHEKSAMSEPSPFLIGRMFVREPSWEYASNCDEAIFGVLKASLNMFWEHSPYSMNIASDWLRAQLCCGWGRNKNKNAWRCR